MSFIFETIIEVRISDINYGRHLGHDSMISLLHEARVRFLNSIGFTENDIDGKGILITRLEIDYLNQAFYKDQLRFLIAVDNMSRTSLHLIYQVDNPTTKKIVAKALTKMTFFDYDQQKVTKIPEKFLYAVK